MYPNALEELVQLSSIRVYKKLLKCCGNTMTPIIQSPREYMYDEYITELGWESTPKVLS